MPMTLCLFEDSTVPHLLPLTHTRAVYDLRIGMRTIAEAAMWCFPGTPSVLQCRAEVSGTTEEEHPGRPVNPAAPPETGTLFLNGRYVAAPGPLVDRLRAAVAGREGGRVFVQDGEIVAAWWPEPPAEAFASGLGSAALLGDLPEERVEGARLVGRLWHLIDDIGSTITRDLDGMAFSREGADVQPGAVLAHPDRIHLAPGAVVRPSAVLNAEAGPIFIGADAVVMEAAVVRGPCYLGAGGQIQMGARVDRAAFGETCKVGGEVHDAVIHSFSNKAHDGYLGNSYIGRWCNLGADTNTSNLKNDYGLLDLYNEHLGRYEPTGRQFLGLFMGDHAKCGINTMFNTATVVGVFCNLFGADYQPRYVPSFIWGSPTRQVPYRLDRAFRVAEAVLERRNYSFTDAARATLRYVSDRTETARAAMLRIHEA